MINAYQKILSSKKRGGDRAILPDGGL